MKLGAARQEAGRAASLVKVTIPKSVAKTASLQFRLDREKLRQVRAREGRYLLRTNLTAGEPAQLWTFYIQLTEVEQAFKELKHDLAMRPIFHRTEERIEAHIFVAFLAYCLQVTLKARLRQLAGGHHAARGAGQVQDDADGGRAYPDHRWPRADPVALHAARARTSHAAAGHAHAAAQQPPPKITTSHVRRLVTDATVV